MSASKFYFKLLVSILRWLVSTPVVWGCKVLACILSPIGVLYVTKENGREKLLPIFHWMTTHDTPVDTWWVAGYLNQRHWLHSKFDQEYYDTHWWLRYVSRVFWIFRNPAYVVAHALGYDQKGMIVTKHKDEGDKWDTGEPNMSYWTAINEKGQIGWMFEWQWYYYKSYCIEVYIGWKLYRKDPDQRCMMVSRIIPWKSYGKK